MRLLEFKAVTTSKKKNRLTAETRRRREERNMNYGCLSSPHLCVSAVNRLCVAGKGVYTRRHDAV
jgi:hypothetical protein